MRGRGGWGRGKLWWENVDNYTGTTIRKKVTDYLIDIFRNNLKYYAFFKKLMIMPMFRVSLKKLLTLTFFDKFNYHSN